MAIKTKEQIRNDAITLIPDNAAREVSPEDVRQRIIDIADSVAFTATLPVLATVATTGAYSDLTGKPVYSAVANTGSYNDLLNKPVFAEVATTGEYVDLINRPNFSTVATSGSYADLTGKPTLTAGTGLTGGGTLSGTVSVALNANTVSSLAKADAALPRNGSQTMTGDLTIFKGTAGGGLVVAGNGVKQVFFGDSTYANEALVYNNPTDGKLIVRPYGTDNISYKEFEFDPVSGDFTVPNNPVGPLAVVPKQFAETYSTGYRNKIINGEFWISQRDSTIPSGVGNRFVTDRWINYASTTPCAVERRVITLTDPGINSALEITPFYLRTTVGAGTAANSRASLNQRMENVRTLAGRKATITFYARADSIKDIAVELYQRFDSASVVAPYVPVSIHAGRVTLTTEWKRYDIVVQVPSIIGKTLGQGSWLEASFWFSGGSSFASETGGLGEQTGVFDITRISIVEGDVRNESDPFSPRHIQQELALCQRYFYQTNAFLPSVWEGCYSGVINTGPSNTVSGTYIYPVTMRTTPALTFYNPASGLYGEARVSGVANYPILSVKGNATGFTQPVYSGTKPTNNNDFLFQFSADAEL